jgi:hypothetical protein
MPKFLTGCHYNEEEISRHLKKFIGYWPVQINGNKFATGEILGKPGRSCEGADFSWLSSKVSRTLFLSMMNYTSSASFTKPVMTISTIPAFVPKVLVGICGRLISIQSVV